MGGGICRSTKNRQKWTKTGGAGEATRRHPAKPAAGREKIAACRAGFG